MTWRAKYEVLCTLNAFMLWPAISWTLEGSPGYQRFNKQWLSCSLCFMVHTLWTWPWINLSSRHNSSEHFVRTRITHRNSSHYPLEPAYVPRLSPWNTTRSCKAAGAAITGACAKLRISQVTKPVALQYSQACECMPDVAEQEALRDLLDKERMLQTKGQLRESDWNFTLEI